LEDAGGKKEFRDVLMVRQHYDYLEETMYESVGLGSRRPGRGTVAIFCEQGIRQPNKTHLSI
jgi:hypothetical protein